MKRDAFFQPENFWRFAGMSYEAEHDPSLFVAQEATIESVLAGLEFQTVLDVGCGFGRIGEIVRKVRPGAAYTGFDVSPDQIAGAQRRLGGWAELHVESVESFSGWRDVQGERRWDLVLAVEVLMHQPPADVGDVVAKVFDWSAGYVLTCDWWREENDAGGNEWNFPHDYPALFGSRLCEVDPLDGQGVFLSRVVLR